MVPASSSIRAAIAGGMSIGAAGRGTETVLYELHAGAFGGFAGVQAALPVLAELGVTAIELMPVNDFPGRWNWGYDGVLPFAPDRSYGTPDELKALVDSAHGLGLMMFLDVVYNHFGPDGITSPPTRRPSSATISPRRGARPSTSAAPRFGGTSPRMLSTG